MTGQVNLGISVSNAAALHAIVSGRPNVAMMYLAGPPGPPGVINAVYPVLYDISTQTISLDLAYFSGTSGVLSDEIYQTGSYLYGITTGASGYLISLINASSVGVSSLNGLSGVLNIGGAGNIFVTAAGQNIIVSGDTGSYANFATVDQLTQTGVAIENQIASVSGFTTGASGALQNQINSLSGATGLYSTGSILYQMITGLSGQTTSEINLVSGALQTGINTTNSNLYQTGADLYALTTGASGYLQQQLNSSSAGVSSVNGLSGALKITGAGNVTVSNNGQVIVVSGDTGVYANFATTAQLTQTGANLQGQINSLSGFVTGTSGYLQNQINALSGATGLYSTGSILYGLITGLSGQVNIDLTGASGALQSQITQVSNNLAQTGSYLYNTTTGASGYLLNLINASSGGVSLLNGLSGAVNINGAGNVSVSVNGQTVVVSGNTGAYANFATISQLEQTGLAIEGQLNSLSGFTTGVSGYLQAQINTLSGATGLYSTGSNLYNMITGLSGQAQNDYATKTSLTTTGTLLSAITVTGSAIINVAKFSGIGGTLVFVSGDQILISGAGSAGSGLAATGYQFFVTGVPAGVDTFYVNYPTGMSTVPVVVPSVRITNDVVYGIAIRDVSKNGFYAYFTNTITGVNEVSLEVHIFESGAYFGGAGGSANIISGSSDNGDGINLSGDLAATGSLLSAVRVTGSSIINNVNIYGLGGTTVFTSGTYVYISGGGSIVTGGSTGTANVENVVYTTGYQDIYGLKNFNTGILITGDVFDTGYFPFIYSGNTGLFILSPYGGMFVGSAIRYALSGYYELSNESISDFLLYSERICGSGSFDPDVGYYPKQTIKSIVISDAVIPNGYGDRSAFGSAFEATATPYASNIYVSSNTGGTGASIGFETYSSPGSEDPYAALTITVSKEDTQYKGIQASYHSSGINFLPDVNVWYPNYATEIRFDNASLVTGNVVTLSWAENILSGDWFTNTTGTDGKSIVNYEALSGVSGALQTLISQSAGGVSGSTTINGNLTVTSGQYQPYKVVSTNYSILPTDTRIYCNNNSPITLTLPAATTCSGLSIKIKLINVGNVVLTGTNESPYVALIDGFTKYDIVGQYTSYELQSFVDSSTSPATPYWYVW